eukprot:gnl/MRDRNA2_/MRDRNA2_73805_c0_seq1.p1 gnl/MRDRNA2_/MRDRNA2_73805_c0~~gnl/MRDRNA2_/MRDRNA2_73805_c0_seq1.p1  ORF type:complete len:251 (-),score=43.58 gnl/MRDRNA2_/MRDRNA2_73805_c0_seq1:48-800(-)
MQWLLRLAVTLVAFLVLVAVLDYCLGIRSRMGLRITDCSSNEAEVQLLRAQVSRLQLDVQKKDREFDELNATALQQKDGARITYFSSTESDATKGIGNPNMLISKQASELPQGTANAALSQQVQELRLSLESERRHTLQRMTDRLAMLPDELEARHQKLQECIDLKERNQEWPAPEQSPLKNVILIMHRLHVGRLGNAREKLRSIEAYRPYFWDLIYLQPISTSQQSKRWIQATLGPWLYPCPPNYKAQR